MIKQMFLKKQKTKKQTFISPKMQHILEQFLKITNSYHMASCDGVIKSERNKMKEIKVN